MFAAGFKTYETGHQICDDLFGEIVSLFVWTLRINENCFDLPRSSICMMIYCCM